MERVGAYHVVRKLGAGGMGSVFEVRHPSTPRRLALKLLNRGVPAKTLERFHREAEILAKVRHPNVVVVHDLGIDERGPFLVTDLVEGSSLEAFVSEGGVRPRKAAEIVRAMADALGAIHALEILHRDLKPENVILRPDGVPVLLDFGVAHDESAHSLTKSGQLVGTPAYMSPEQARGERSRQGPWTDVYGLGGILFALLTGGPPFSGVSVVELIARILKSEPSWPSADRDGVPPALEAICRRAMSKEPKDRYQDMAELADALDGFLHAPETAQAQHSPWRVWAARVGGALLVAGLVWALGSGEARPEDTTAGESPIETPVASPAEPPVEPPVDPAKDEGTAAAADPDALLRELQTVPAAAFRERIAQAQLPAHVEEALRRARRGLAELEKSAARKDTPAKDLVTAAEEWADEFAGAFPVLVEETAAPLVQNLRMQAELRRVTLVRSMIGWREGGRVVAVDDTRVILANQRGALLLVVAEKTWKVLSLKPDRDVALLGDHALVLEGSSLHVRALEPGDDPLATEAFPETPVRLAAGPGQAVAVGFESGAIELLEVSPDATIRRGRRLEGHQSGIRALAFSPDGATLISSATGAGNAPTDPSTRLWETATGAERARVQHLSTPSCLAISPDGQWFVVGLQGVNQLCVYALESGAELGSFTAPDARPSRPGSAAAHDAAPLDVQLSPDGALLYSLAGDPGGPRELRVWDTVERAPLRRLFEWNQQVSSLCLIDQGRLLVGVGDRSQVWTWNVGPIPAWPPEVRARWK